MLTNPESHTVRTRGSVLAEVASPGLRKEAPDFSGLAAQLEGASLIVVEGGDGTVQAVASAMLSRAETGAPLPRLMLVPGGMTDLVARIAGVPRDPDLVARLIERGGERTRLPALRIEGAGLRHGFFLSTAGVPRGIEYARGQVQAKGAEGAFAVAGAIGGVLMKAERREAVLRPDPLEASLDGDPLPWTDHRFALLTTLPRLMVGLDPFWGVGPGPIRTTLARGDSRHLKRSLARLWVGWGPGDAEQNGYISRNVGEVGLRTDGPVILDGEEVPSGRALSITAPRELTLVRA